MFQRRDDFSPGVKAILAHRAGHRCSKPSCRALTAGPSDEGPDAQINIGVAAHITAAAPDGPRFDAALTTEERRSANNGLWLCQTHAKEIDDDVAHFTVHTLRGWKRHAEEDARALLGRPISAQALDISVQVNLHRAADDGLIVTGGTNLPDGAKLFVELQASGLGRCLGQCRAVVSGGMFAAGGFRNGNIAHHHGWYTVEVLAYFNGPWQQPEAVLAITGREGDKLVGRFAEALHPELSESEKRFRAAFECVAPPLQRAGTRTADDLRRAVCIVQTAVLCVDGRRSASPVGEVVDWFVSTPGLKCRDGWSAIELPNGAVIVSFSFWNGPEPAVAEWIVILESQEVRYWNLHGKYMSWAPDY